MSTTSTESMTTAYSTHCDALTGLLTKAPFFERIQQQRDSWNSESYGILCADVEGLRFVNALHGLDAGDSVLRHIGRSLTLLFKDSPYPMGRLEGMGCFALCLPQASLDEVTAKISVIFSEVPLNANVLPRFGFCPFGGEDSPGLVCERALMALHMGRQEHQRHVSFFDPGFVQSQLRHRYLLARLPLALRNREFHVFVQPKCDMSSGMILGAEALARWQTPEGNISPGEFIPIFEESGDIAAVDRYIWEEVARFQRSCLDKGITPVPIAVNISRVDIEHMNVCAVLQEIVDQYNIPHELLQTEITESACVRNADALIGAANALRNSGFTVFMDDFGSGYSSFNILKDINVDILKIDLRFLDNFSLKGQDVLRSVMSVSRWLNLDVVAEGVETKEQADFLLAVGCCCGQGYYFYRPMPLSTFEELLCSPGKIAQWESCTHAAPNLLDFQALLHKGLLSDRLLNRLIGAAASYIYKDGSLLLKKANAEYCEITGHTVHSDEEKMTDILHRVHPEDRERLRATVERVLQSGASDCAEIYLRERREKGLIWLRVRFFTLPEVASQGVCYATVVDVSENMKMQERLRQSEELFCLAMEAVKTVIFEVDMTSRRVSFSEQIQTMFGLPATSMVAPDDFIAAGMVSGHSLPAYRQLYQKFYDGAPCVSEHVRIKQGNRYSWYKITLRTVSRPHGESAKGIGIMEVCDGNNDAYLRRCFRRRLARTPRYS